MGYTNYWTPKNLTENEVPARFWDDVEKVLDKIIESGVALADSMGETEMTSGYEIVNYREPEDNIPPSITFNGLGEDGCETFDLIFDGIWNCCKTRREPYDIAVKCVLMLASKYDLLATDENGEDGWSFDGGEQDIEYVNASNLLLELELI